MPQLDFLTYFTQFHWFLCLFILIFFYINNKYIPTFQSLFIIRNFLLQPNRLQNCSKDLSSLPTSVNRALSAQPLLGAPRVSSQSLITNWEKIYEQGGRTMHEMHGTKGATIIQSNKLNDSNYNKSNP